MQGQYYLPSQPAEQGSFLISLGNTGAFPVTIEAVHVLPPGLPASAVSYGSPLRMAGQPTYTLEDLRHGQRAPGPRPLAGAVLTPGEYVYVRIPFITAKCWLPHSSTGIDRVWVTTKSLLWTHHVPISWTEPADPSQGAIISEEGYAPGAILGLVCPK